jgi:hypothetical protein
MMSLTGVVVLVLVSRSQTIKFVKSFFICLTTSPTSSTPCGPTGPLICPNPYPQNDPEYCELTTEKTVLKTPIVAIAGLE